MSDTPRTDELAKREFVPDGLWIKHARELERENAALREQIENLGGENRRLRKVVAAPAMITWAMNGKEAQP